MMLSSISGISNSFNSNLLSRAGQAVVRQGSAVAGAEEEALRAVNSIAAPNEWNGIGNAQGQDDPAAAANDQGFASRDAAPDLTGAAADLVVNKTAMRASIAVLKTADRMVGSLLDVVG